MHLLDKLFSEKNLQILLVFAYYKQNICQWDKKNNLV